MVADIIIVATIILFFFIGIKRGLASGLLNLIAIVLVAFVAGHLAGMLSDAVYDNFIKQGVITNIETSIEQSGFDQTLEDSLSFMPQWIFGFITMLSAVFGISVSDIQNGLAFEKVSQTTAQAVESLISPLIVSVISVLFFVLLFALILFLLKILVIKHILKIFNLPIIKQINALLGGILGLAEGFLIVWIGVNILCVLLNTPENSPASSDILNGAIFNFFAVL